jgi:hypothetical protein
MVEIRLQFVLDTSKIGSRYANHAIVSISPVAQMQEKLWKKTNENTMIFDMSYII